MAWWNSSKSRTRIWVYLAVIAVVFTMISLTGTAILGFYTMLSWQTSSRRPVSQLTIPAAAQSQHDVPGVGVASARW